MTMASTALLEHPDRACSGLRLPAHTDVSMARMAATSMRNASVTMRTTVMPRMVRTTSSCGSICEKEEVGRA